MKRRSTSNQQKIAPTQTFRCEKCNSNNVNPLPGGSTGRWGPILSCKDCGHSFSTPSSS